MSLEAGGQKSVGRQYYALSMLLEGDMHLERAN